MSDRLIVLSGCSAGGKSTVLDEMAKRGVRVCAEPGRRVVAQQELIGGDGLPWSNPEKFLQLCLELAIEDHVAASASAEVTLFDRSLVDTVAGLVRLAQLERDTTSAEGYLGLLERYRYATGVMLAPPWPELYAAGADDSQRKHSFDEAVIEFDHLRLIYPQYGYAVTELPKGSVAQRADYLATVIAAAE